MPLALDQASMSPWIAIRPIAAPVTSAYRINARHSGGSRNPALSFDVIPAQAGIHVDFVLEVQGFHSPCGRAGNFSLLVQRKVTKRNTPQVARLPGILPSRFARGLRGSLSARPCARNELARILRATLRAFPSPPRRATGAPFRRHPAAEAVARSPYSCARFTEKQTIEATGLTSFAVGSRRNNEQRANPARATGADNGSTP